MQSAIENLQYKRKTWLRKNKAPQSIFAQTAHTRSPSGSAAALSAASGIHSKSILIQISLLLLENQVLHKKQNLFRFLQCPCRKEKGF